MTEAAQHPVGGPDPVADEAATVGLLRAARRDEQAAALRSADAIVAWVGSCGTDPAVAGAARVATAARASDVFGESSVAIAGEGAPLVPEYALVGVCTALGMGKHAGRNHVGNVVELAWRLPRLWAQVRVGRCVLWRACRIAERTRPLSVEAAAHVDARLARFAGSCTATQVDRTVTAAVAACDPDRAAADAAAAAEQRHVRIGLDETDVSGVGYLDAVLDAADLLDVEAAVADRAGELARLGSTESLDVRRARALGEIARADSLIEFDAAPAAPADPADRRPRPRRRVVLHVHLSRAAVAGAGGAAGADTSSGGPARVEGLSAPVTAEQVRAWCGTAGTVLVRPVIDLADHTPVDSYEVPDGMRRQVVERDRHCVFPYCTAPASRADMDHIVPFHPPGQPTGLAPGGADPPERGPTAASNLAPLCRLHHRTKTHGGWAYEMVRPGTYHWRSRTCEHYLVDDAGTHPLDLP